MNDKQLVKFTAAFKRGILGKSSSDGACFMVCAPLVSLLNLHGVAAELVNRKMGNGNHYWIKLADGRVLDPTAEQFNNRSVSQWPPVYLGRPYSLHGADEE
jgi:hypothetical protein